MTNKKDQDAQDLAKVWSDGSLLNNKAIDENYEFTDEKTVSDIKHKLIARGEPWTLLAEHDVLIKGDQGVVRAQNDVVIFERSSDALQLTCAVNLSEDVKTFTLDGTYADVAGPLSGAQLDGMTVTLKPWGVAVLRRAN